MPEQQLTLFDDNVQIVEKVSGITMFRCDLDATRWITPGSLCPMCHPSQEVAVCDTCGSEFEDSRRMIEHMRIGGQVQCNLCLPRVGSDCDRPAPEREGGSYEAEQMGLPGTTRGTVIRFARLPINEE